MQLQKGKNYFETGKKENNQMVGAEDSNIYLKLHIYHIIKIKLIFIFGKCISITLTYSSNTFYSNYILFQYFFSLHRFLSLVSIWFHIDEAIYIFISMYIYFLFILIVICIKSSLKAIKYSYTLLYQSKLKRTIPTFNKQ